MAAVIEFSHQASWSPDVSGALVPGPGVETVFARSIPFPWSFDRGIKFGFRAVSYDASDIMTEFWLLSKHKVLGDVLPVSARWGCSAEFKALVEALEPGMHQFFPITIRRPDGKPILRADGREVGPGQYYILNALQAVDALLPDHCIGPRGEKRQSLAQLTRDDDLCVARSAITGRHLWINEPFYKSGLYFVSNELGTAIQAQGLKGLKLRKVREV